MKADKRVIAYAKRYNDKGRKISWVRIKHLSEVLKGALGRIDCKGMYVRGIDIAPFIHAYFEDGYNYSRPFKLEALVVKEEGLDYWLSKTTDKVTITFVDEIYWGEELETSVFSFQNLYLNVNKQTLHYVDILKGKHVLRDAVKTNSDYNPLKEVQTGCIDYLHFEPTELNKQLKKRVKYMLDELGWITLPEIEELIRKED